MFYGKLGIRVSLYVKRGVSRRDLEILLGTRPDRSLVFGLGDLVLSIMPEEWRQQRYLPLWESSHKEYKKKPLILHRPH
jgi:hypothetical protein